MATSAGQVQSTIKVKATAQNLDKVEAQVSKLMLASEKIRTQQAKTATQMAKAIAVQNKDAAAKQKAALQAEKLSLQNQKLSNSISNATNKQSLFNKVLNTGKILALGYTIKNLGNAFTSLIQGSADYIENLNLFNVVMGESTEKAENFINTMNDVLGLDTSKMMQYMGTFKGMANNMGIAEDAAYTMSEGLTKLTYDLSSFYNTSVDQAFTSLSSAITGQTKSIREQFKGIDVTMGTLQVDLDILGIDKTVSELSYAEKSILRYISILRQSQSAQGDFARTMTSPAQMMRQLTERVITLARAFGNIFIPILQAVLPYILAVTSLLTKLFNTISAFVAKIFGFEMPEFDYSGITTGLGSASDDLDAVGDSASGASDKVKEFKKQLQGFDVLNVITSPTDTPDSGGTSGGGGGGAGMIDPALLEAIKNYDNRLDLASDKVKELEAAIQSFLSKLDFEPLKKSLDNLWESMKLVGNFAWQGLKDFYNEFLVPVAQWTIGEGLPRFIDAIANGLAKIDWDNLNSKLYDLFQALAPFAINVGEGLLWFFENVLVPLATWTISDVLPNFLSMLASALKILNSGIEVAAPLLSWLWDHFLAPIASFAGGAIVGILEGVASALEWIADNELASKVLGSVLTALIGIAAVKTAKSLIDTAGGLSSIVSSAIQAHSKTSALNKVLLTIGNTAKKSKGSVVLIGKDIKDLATKSSGTITVGNVLITMLKNMGSAAKGIVGNITNLGGKISSLGSKILTFGKNLITGNINAKTLGKTISGTLKNAFSSLTSPIKTLGSNIKTASTTFSQTASVASKLGSTLLGGFGLIVGLKATSSGMKDVANQGEITALSLGKVVGGMASSAAAGAKLLSALGPAGVVIGGIAGGLAGAASALFGYNKACEEQKAYANMFDGQGVAIERVTDTLKNLYNTYAEQTETIQEYSSKINDLKDSLNDTSGSMDILLGKLSSGSYNAEESDFNQISDDIKNLQDTTSDLIQTETNQAINFIQFQERQGQISKDTAADRISNALAVQQVEEKINSEYATAMQNLTEQYKNGEINAQTYATEMGKLKELYSTTATASDETTVSVKNLVEQISAKGIDFKSYEDTKKFVNEVGDTYKQNKETINNYYKEQKKQLEQEQIDLQARMDKAKELYGEDSEEYQAYVTRYNDLTSQMSELESGRKQDLDELKGTYKGIYEGILTEMETTGFASTEKGEEIASKINDSLEKIGDVDYSQLGEEMYTAITGQLAHVNTSISTEDLPQFVENLKNFGKEGAKGFESGTKDIDENGLKIYYGQVGANNKNAYKESATFKQPDKDELVNSYKDGGTQIGKGAMEGQAKGIKDNTDKVNSAMKDSKEAIEAYAKSKSVWNINSPSKVSQKWGDSIDEGLAKGIKDNTDKVKKAIKNQLDDIEKVFNSKEFKINISSDVTSSFNSILSKLETFCSRFRNAINSLASGMSATMNGIKINDKGKVTYTKMPYINVPRFAEGGLPDVGSMFVAGEAGPEWVGDIGGRTGVLNSRQLSDAFASALDRVMSKHMNGNQTLNATIPVYVGGDKVDEKQRQINLRNNNIYGTAR